MESSPHDQLQPQPALPHDRRQRLIDERVKKVFLILLWIGLLTFASEVVYLAFNNRAVLNARRRADSPSGNLFAVALPFTGSKPHPLDGRLRVLVMGEFSGKFQTTLRGTRQTRLEWFADASPPSFRIYDEQGTRMVWRVEDQKIICVQGQEFLALDPYDLNAVER